MADPVRRWASIAKAAEEHYGIPAATLLGLIKIESGGVEGRTSSAGAGGLTQFMPGTAKGFGVNVAPGHARSQIYGAAKYLKQLGYSSNPELALKKYNAGPGNPGAAGAYGRNVLSAAHGYGGVAADAQPSSGGGGGGGGGGTTTPGGQTMTTTTGQPSLGAQQSQLPLVQALLDSQQSAGPPAANIQAPSFSAHPTLPEGFGTVSGAGGPAPKADIGALAAAVKTLGGDVPQAPQTQQTTDTPATDQPNAPDVSGNYPAMSGKVKFAPNADRPGVKTQPITKEFLGRVAGFSHREIDVGTGTNHNRMTTSGNVSDHWTGHAADIPRPVDSKLGDLTAAHALEAAGVPWSEAYRMAQKGGVFNVTPKSGRFKGHRVQVLWKTMVGGNHHNHVHVGIR